MTVMTLANMAGVAWLACVVAATPALGDGARQTATTAAQEKPAAAAPAGHPGEAMGLGGGMPAPAEKMTGAVLETIDAAGYTYLRLRTGGGEAWAAVTQAKVAVGATVTVLVSLRMESFESKSLKRTFDHLIMGTLEAPEGPAERPGDVAAVLPSHGSAAPEVRPAGVPPGHPPIGSGGAAAGPIKVPKAEGAKGRTVAEVWQERTALKDRPVAVRGKVVKFLSDIMGKNWLHLRDGSGSAGTGDDDITVTTSGAASVGDVIVVTGTVRVGRNFGAGYSYPVMIEDATVSR